MKAVCAETDQGDRRRRDSGADRDRELDEVPGDPAPGEKTRPVDEAIALSADGNRRGVIWSSMTTDKAYRGENPSPSRRRRFRAYAGG